MFTWRPESEAAAALSREARRLAKENPAVAAELVEVAIRKMTYQELAALLDRLSPKPVQQHSQAWYDERGCGQF